MSSLKYISSLLLLPLILLYGCSPGLPSDGDTESIPGELTQDEYAKLTDQQKYQVSNKLLGTMFKGMPVDEFFDISSGMSRPRLKKGENFLSNTKTALSNKLTESEVFFNDNVITDIDNQSSDSLFQIDFDRSDSDWPKHMPMARIFQYPLSKEFFDNWIAYVLVNTILFSPAQEIDSTSIRDVQKVFFKLKNDLAQNKSISQIIARHQRSQENWRRFRSPEDNTREMIEIYLGLFDRDADVPRASIACKDLYLSDEDNDYELLSTGFPNTEPQYVLDTFVTTCDDFYDVIANHPLVISRVTTVLAEYLLFNKTGEERAEIVNTIVSQGPTTFQQIFKGILFNKTYLLDNERPKSIEENFFSTAHQMDWKPYRSILSDMTGTSSALGQVNLNQVGWPTMTLKLGRFTGVPLDSQSFANYHKSIRERLLLGSTGTGSCTSSGEVGGDRGTRCRWSNGMGLKLRSSPSAPASDASEQAKDKYQYEVARLNKLTERNQRVMALSVEDYIDYVFMTALQRRANNTERADLINYFYDLNQDGSGGSGSDYLQDLAEGGLAIRDGRHDEIAQVIFDYASRLPEYYYFLRIN